MSYSAPQNPAISPCLPGLGLQVQGACGQAEGSEVGGRQGEQQGGVGRKREGGEQVGGRKGRERRRGEEEGQKLMGKVAADPFLRVRCIPPFPTPPAHLTWVCPEYHWSPVLCCPSQQLVEWRPPQTPMEATVGKEAVTFPLSLGLSAHPHFQALLPYEPSLTFL